MFLRNVNCGVLVLVLGALCLSGCSHQDFGRPVSSPVTDLFDSGKPYIDSTEEALALDRSRKFAKALAEWQLQSPDEKPDYHIGPEDAVQLEILSFETPGKPSTLLRTVGNDGMINLSWAGKVKISGLNLQEAEKAISAHLAAGYIKNPSVALKIAEYKSAGIVITGAVSKPGVYYMKRDRRTLLEILAQADGLDMKSGDELLLVRGKQSMKTAVLGGGSETNSLIVVDLKQLVDDGDLRANLWVQRGDIITVQPRKSNYICVLGYVNRPGSFDIAGKGKMSALDAVGMAGGLTGIARAENSWLLRQTPKGQKMVPVDITAMARGARAPLYMESGDTLVIGSSAFAKLSEFIKPSVSAGASFSPAP
jgi:protein involved in polysaccharide export with SLBB domain